MEIRELVEKTFRLKILRNNLEIISDELRAEDVAKANEDNNKDRCGLDYEASSPHINDAINSINFGLKQIYEGIAFLEAAHRQSIRFREPKEDKTSESK